MSTGKTGGLSSLVRSLCPDRLWWLLDAFEELVSRADTLGMRPNDESLVAASLAWLPGWEDVTVDVEGAPVFLKCAAMLVTAAATSARNGTWRRAFVLGGEAGTVSSISSSANSSRSEEGTKSGAGCAVTTGESTGTAGFPDVVVGGNSMTSGPGCAAGAVLGGRTSPSGIGGLNLLPQRPSRNADQRWLCISSCTGTL